MPCPIRGSDIQYKKQVRRTKARMDARTRERLPAPARNTEPRPTPNGTSSSATSSTASSPSATACIHHRPRQRRPSLLRRRTTNLAALRQPRQRHPRQPLRTVTGLDDDNTARLLIAIRHAAGKRPENSSYRMPR